MTDDRLISIDAETNGLAGRAFAVALTLTDPAGELANVVLRCPLGEATDPWVADNVLPAIADVPENTANYPELLAELDAAIQRWGGNDTPLIAHVAWPVEARLLLDVYSGQRVWDGPYPLIDVASVLLAKGHDPLTVDGYLKAHSIPVPDGSPHHPLYDARAAERCFRHLMATAQTTTPPAVANAEPISGVGERDPMGEPAADELSGSARHSCRDPNCHGQHPHPAGVCWPKDGHDG